MASPALLKSHQVRSSQPHVRSDGTESCFLQAQSPFWLHYRDLPEMLGGASEWEVNKIFPKSEIQFSFPRLYRAKAE